MFNSNTFTVLKGSKVFRTLIDGVQKASMYSISVTKECSRWEYIFFAVRKGAGEIPVIAPSKDFFLFKN